MTQDDLRTRQLEFAGVAALTVLTWYALPDAVRRRGTRVVIKVGLLGVTAAGVLMMPQVFPDMRELASRRLDLPAPTTAALAVSASAVALLGTIWGEKAVYARGERLRARGVRCAHTPVAVMLALATGAAVLVDWSKLSRRT